LSFNGQEAHLKARHTEVDHIHSIAILSTEQTSRVNIKHSAINSGKGISFSQPKLYWEEEYF
jgi:hypothetical protein